MDSNSANTSESKDALGSRLDDAVDAAFDAHQLPLLERLVNAPSHSFAKADVEDAFAILDAAARESGFHVEVVPSGDDRFAAHRVYTSGPAGSERLALVGHLDTVFPKKMGFLTFTRATDDDQLSDVVRGPGTLDMKSGLTAIIFAVRALKATVPDVVDDLPVSFICVSDEETGSPSSTALYEELAKSLRCALVFEAGRDEDKIVTTRRGAAVFTVTCEGKAAHAGNKHEDGVNAIHAMALLIPRIETLTNYDAGVTVNVGLIEGGTAKNTVPDRAQITIDMRFTTMAGGDDAIAALKKLVAAPFFDDVTPARLRQARFVVNGKISRPPMEKLPGTDALRSVYERHAHSVGLKVGEAPLQGGGSDANLLAAHGVPVIDGLGPFGKHFHQIEEWSSVESLRRRTKALARFIADENWRTVPRTPS